jgi:peptidoglycan/xylan/chitin deacetylase (PgdA/CDA1 family)
MRRPVARTVYSLCKAIGLFAYARRQMRGHLRVLCYHGFALEDEADFRPSLFLSPRVLEQRLDYLSRNGFRVIPLDQAASELRDGTIGADSVTITIDDGFHSTHAAALPVFTRHGFPATLYLTSYYFEKATPIFQLAIDYICWKSQCAEADLAGLGVPELDRIGRVRLDSAMRRKVSRTVFEFGSDALNQTDRQALAQRLGQRLGVDYARIRDSRILSLVSPRELVELERAGIAIELHTHRHRLPLEHKAAVEELAANRAAIEPLIGRAMTHFCYPSGFQAEEHLPALRSAGVRTAATCQPGLVRPGENPLALPRILDDSRVSQIEFEAEVSGFSEMIRSLRRRFWARATPFTVTGDWVIKTTMPVMGI